MDWNSLGNAITGKWIYTHLTDPYSNDIYRDANFEHADFAYSPPSYVGSNSYKEPFHEIPLTSPSNPNYELLAVPDSYVQPDLYPGGVLTVSVDNDGHTATTEVHWD